jgi:hypothetical protein
MLEREQEKLKVASRETPAAELPASTDPDYIAQPMNTEENQEE